MVMGDNTTPTDTAEVLFTIVIVLLGSCINATIFANVSNLVARMAAKSAGHARKMEGIAAAMRVLKVPRKVAARVRAYFEYTHVRHDDHDGDRFIATLPPQLRGVRMLVLVLAPSRHATRTRHTHTHTHAHARTHKHAHAPILLHPCHAARVCLQRHENAIRAVPLFERADRRLISAIASELMPEVFLPSELILVAG